MQTQFWWRHVRWPLLAFLLLAVPLAFSDTDLAIARLLYFDNANLRWIGSGNWWVETVLHTGGRWFVRMLVALAALMWLLGHVRPELRSMRRTAAYFVVAVVLSVGIVGLLKTVTNVDCPWNLIPFGGRFPFVHLFADRADDLQRARCFPAAHASSGYALLALYFVWRERSRPLATLGLALGLATGILFGIAQQSRGAHFLSHDVWSAFIVWVIATSVYAFAFAGRLAQPLAGDTAAVPAVRGHAGGAVPEPASQ